MGERGQIAKGISSSEFAGSSNNLSNTPVSSWLPSPVHGIRRPTRQSKSCPFGGSDFPVCSLMPAGIRADESGQRWRGRFGSFASPSSLPLSLSLSYFSFLRLTYVFSYTLSLCVYSFDLTSAYVGGVGLV